MTINGSGHEVPWLGAWARRDVRVAMTVPGKHWSTPAWMGLAARIRGNVARLATSARHTVVSPWPLLWVAILGVGLTVRILERPEYILRAPEDDELFVRMAQGLVHFNWGTPWSVSSTDTLAKPIGYPLFLAIAHLVPWNPVVSVYLIYLLGAVLIACGWASISHSRLQSTVLLAALTLAPVLWAFGNQRIYRDAFSEAIGALGMGFAFILAARVNAGKGGRRLSLCVLVLIGLCVGVQAITKPSWYWMLLAVAVPLAYPLWRRLVTSPRRLRAVVAGVVAVAVVGVSGWAVIEATTLENFRVYGVAVLDDFDKGQFARAWKEWVSVEAGPKPVWYDPINPQMRAAVYRVSPAARLMSPYFGTSNSVWTSTNCLYLKMPPPPQAGIPAGTRCDDSGHWAIWDLRGSAGRVGQATSASSFEAYFKTVADQISAACASGRLRCDKAPVVGAGLVPLDDIPVAATTHRSIGGLWQMIRAQYQYLPETYSYPPSLYPTYVSLHQEWAQVVNGLPPLNQTSDATPAALFTILRGWGKVYAVLSVAALAALALGLLRGLYVFARGRRLRLTGWPAAALTAAVLFGLTGLVSVAGLAAAQPIYVNALYWSDFAPVVELFVVFSGFAAAALLTRRSHRRGEPRGDTGHSTVTTPSTDLLVGASVQTGT